MVLFLCARARRTTLDGALPYMCCSFDAAGVVIAIAIAITMGGNTVDDD